MVLIKDTSVILATCGPQTGAHIMPLIASRDNATRNVGDFCREDDHKCGTICGTSTSRVVYA